MAALLGALTGGCGKESPPAGPAAPASSTAPIRADDDRAALTALADLQRQGDKAVAARQHGPLWRTADGIDRLSFRDDGHTARKEELIRTFRAEAARIRDALHRFLFPELGPLPAAERKALLAAADRGEADIIDRSAHALADHYFALSKAHLRATETLRSGRRDPATGLAVRYAGRAASPWKKQFNRAFNARMRTIVQAGKPAR